MKKLLRKWLFSQTTTIDSELRRLQDIFGTENVSISASSCHYPHQPNGFIYRQFTLHIKGQCVIGDSIQSCIDQMKLKLSQFTHEAENIIL